jgi:hypothetical protein
MAPQTSRRTKKLTSKLTEKKRKEILVEKKVGRQQ